MPPQCITRFSTYGKSHMCGDATGETVTWMRLQRRDSGHLHLRLILCVIIKMVSHINSVIILTISSRSVTFHIRNRVLDPSFSADGYQQALCILTSQKPQNPSSATVR